MPVGCPEATGRFWLEADVPAPESVTKNACVRSRPKEDIL